MADFKQVTGAIWDSIAEQIGGQTVEKQSLNAGLVVFLQNAATNNDHGISDLKKEWRAQAAAMAERGLTTGDSEYDEEYASYRDELETLKGHKKSVFGASTRMAEKISR